MLLSAACLRGFHGPCTSKRAASQIQCHRLLSSTPYTIQNKQNNTQAVEPVVDSSRYFVVRVVDRGDAKKRAFVGLGFRERSAASDFAAALDDYRRLVRRAREAEEMRQRFEAARVGGGGSDGGGSGDAAAAASSSSPCVEDYSLKAPIRLSLPSTAKRPAADDDDEHGGGGFFGGSGSGSGDAQRPLARTVSRPAGDVAPPAVISTPTGGLKLAPPPPPPPPPSGSKAAAPSSGVGGGQTGGQGSVAGAAAAAAAAVAGSAGTAAPQVDDDDWADFQS